MKRIFGFLFFLPFIASAQPNGYYTSAFGLNGQPLRAQLHTIIMGHNSIGYAALWTAYQQTDVKPNGKVWDMYSDIPGQSPPYEFTFGTDQCGNYNSENDCYNREHSFPESYFGASEPMRSDLFMVYPTDGFVNNKRSNYPYGKVNNPTWTSQNGSKLGPNNYSGAPSGTAFEPIDSFKGDLARTYFYFSTRYYSEDNGWDNWEMADGANLKPWAIQMLLDWHHNDPVSLKEINRNNAVYTFQNNRNPFIDYPVFADCIWGTGNCGFLSAGSFEHLVDVRISPNPASNIVSLEFSATASEHPSVSIYNTTGQLVYRNEAPAEEKLIIPVSGWTKGFYFIHLTGTQGALVKKLVIQ